MGSLLLKEVCRRTGVTRRAVQGYEKFGLVSPCGRNKMGYLLYDSNALEKIREIKQLQRRGFSLKEIKTLESATAVQRKRTLELKLEILQKNHCIMHEMTAIVQSMIDSL